MNPLTRWVTSRMTFPGAVRASPDAESQPPELLSSVFAVGGRGMDLLLVLAPIVVSVVIALSRSETTRWLLYLVYCWWLVTQYSPEALICGTHGPSVSVPI